MKGWRIPATPPYVSSYLFLLPVYDAPSSVERGEKIGEEERRGRREVRGGEGGRWFVNIHYVCAEKGEVVGEKNGSETRRWEYPRGKTCATHGTQEFTAMRARVKRTGTKKETEKNVPPNQCSRPTELIPPRKTFLSLPYSRDVISRGMLASTGTTFQNQSATNQPSVPGIYRGDECPQFFIIFNTHMYSFPCSVRRTMASVIRSISDMRCARAACRK